jgi:predicted N-acetyltransferase YhbS
MATAINTGKKIAIRRATVDDATACGRICYEAFADINTRHGFAPDFPNAEIATGLLSMIFSHPGFYAVVAESNGEIVGSNALDERTTIAGLGPITVDPAVQNGGIGRALMEALLERYAARGFKGVRLLQAAFHNRSLSLYTKLGFDPVEPMSVMNGSFQRTVPAGHRVRGANETDITVCNALCRHVHGHDRAGELSDAVAQGSALVVERDGRITGYATSFGYFGHAAAEQNSDLQALIASAPEVIGPGIIVPTRNAELFRWCLERGLRVIHPMTLMVSGFYQQPAGAYLPSVLY